MAQQLVEKQFQDFEPSLGTSRGLKRGCNYAASSLDCLLQVSLEFFSTEISSPPLFLTDTLSVDFCSVQEPERKKARPGVVRNKLQVPFGNDVSEKLSGEDNESSGMIVFDWDDTLYPTTWRGRLSKKGKVLSNDMQKAAAELDLAVLTVLKKAATLTKLAFLVTNGSLRWVHRSSKSLLPKTHDFLFAEESKGRSPCPIRIVSARDDYKQGAFDCDGVRWKIDAFNELVCTNIPERKLASNLRRSLSPLSTEPFSLLSIGDGEPEVQATENASKMISGCIKKLVIFPPASDIVELASRMEDVALDLESIFSSREKCKRVY